MSGGEWFVLDSQFSSIKHLLTWLAERFANKLARYTTCRLVQFFCVITVDDREREAGPNWQERVCYQNGITMSPADGVLARLQLR